MYNSNKAILSNLLIDGWTLSSVDKMYYILHRSHVGSLNITGLVFKNTDVKSRTAVHAIGVPSLMISNSTFQSSTISSDNTIQYFLKRNYEIKLCTLNFSLSRAIKAWIPQNHLS